jgi:hypothetical protein
MAFGEIAVCSFCEPTKTKHVVTGLNQLLYIISTALWRANKNTCVELLQEVENHQPRLFVRMRRSTRFLSDWTCFQFLSHCTLHKPLCTTSHLKSHAEVPPFPRWGQICTWHPLIICTRNKIGQSILGFRPMFATFTLVLKKTTRQGTLVHSL